MTYTPKTKPMSHQAAELHISADLDVRAILWEQGTGKTKLTIDTLGEKIARGEVDALLIVAPNGVHRNWITDELPKHLPDEIAKTMRSHLWFAGKAANKGQTRDREELIKHDGLAVLAITYEAFLTKLGKLYTKRFLTQRSVFFVLDEAQRIKNPAAKRTKTILAAGAYAKHKRILSGTPVPNGPFDIYAPIKFLKTDFWKEIGCGNFAAFKAMFGIWQRIELSEGRSFESCVAFQNLEILNKQLEKIASRVLKEDVLDLPPKVYQKRYFELTPEQRRLYTSLREEMMVDLESGELLTAALAIVRLLRFQQITSGYLPDGDDGPLIDIPGANPRLDLLSEIVDDTPGKIIIWCRFSRDIDKIMERFGDLAVRYDGSSSDEERAEAIDSFQNNPEGARIFVANPAAAGEGLTLHAAKTVIYYSNSFNLSQRLQSEDRAHRIGQDSSVTYIDLIAPGTIDAKLVAALRDKLNVAATITGDSIKEWI